MYILHYTQHLKATQTNSTNSRASPKERTTDQQHPTGTSRTL